VCTEVGPIATKMESVTKQSMVSSMGVPSIDLTAKSVGVPNLVTTVLSSRMVTTVSNNYGSRSSTVGESDIRQSYAVASKISTEPIMPLPPRNEKLPLEKDLQFALRDGASKHVIVKGKLRQFYEFVIQYARI